MNYYFAYFPHMLMMVDLLISYTNLYNIGKNDTIKKYMSEIKDIWIIEDHTVNGWIKVNKILDCPDFLCNGRIDILTKEVQKEPEVLYLHM